MSRLKAALVTLIGLGFVAVGFLILSKGDAESRTLALGCIAFFGACAAVGVINLLPRGRAELDADGGFTLRPDRGRNFAMAIASFAMGVGCYVLALADGKVVVGYVAWFGVAFFGLGSFGILWQAFRLRPLARLDRNGVQVFGPNAYTLSWNDVDSVELVEIKSQPLVAFRSSKTPPPLLIPFGFLLSNVGSKIAIEDLASLAEQLWRQHRRI